MLGLRKKQAEKAKEEKMEVDASNNDSATPTSTGEANEATGESSEATEENGQVSLLGIGGKQIKGTVKRAAKKKTPGEIRIQKGIYNFINISLFISFFVFLFRWLILLSICCFLDISELDGGKVAQIDFPNPNDLTYFLVTIKPDSGYWAEATYVFSFTIPALYPHEAPKVLCKTKIYHPNINLEGNVCLNILREDWKPVLDINAVIYGLIYLFYEPNPDDPLNREAADMYRNDRSMFGRIVKKTLQGLPHNGESFERLIK